MSGDDRLQNYRKWRGNFDMDIIDKLKEKVETRKRAEAQTKALKPGAPVLTWILKRQRTRFRLLNEHFAGLRVQSEEAEQLSKVRYRLRELAKEDMK